MSGDAYYQLLQQLKPLLAKLIEHMVAEEKRISEQDEPLPMNDEDLELALEEAGKITPDLSALGWWFILEVLDLILDEDAAWRPEDTE